MDGVLIDAGKHYYRLVYEKSKTKGRRLRETASACLYIASRVRGAPFMLIDFQDATKINVFKLGRCFVSFCRALFLALPNIDPSLFIPRFCS
jgi:transcription factor IIIB subunit 2